MGARAAHTQPVRHHFKGSQDKKMATAGLAHEKEMQFILKGTLEKALKCS